MFCIKWLVNALFTLNKKIVNNILTVLVSSAILNTGANLNGG